MKHIAVYEKFENFSPLIESEQSMNSLQALKMATKAIESAGAGAKPDPALSKAIVDCINRGNFIHLKILTTGAGAFALGALTICFYSGVATVPAVLIMAAGAIIITLEEFASDEVGKSATDEIKDLISCLQKKGAI